MTTGTLLNLKLTLTPSNIGVTIGGSPTQQLITTLFPFYVGATGPAGAAGSTDAATTSVTPDPAVDLDSTDAQSAFVELAGDTQTLKNRLDGLVPFHQLDQLP